jgi:hypothetical protein
MAGGVTPGKAPPTEFAAINALSSGMTPSNWWNRTGNTQGNLYANNLQNEYVLPSNAVTPGTFGYAVNPNVTDPALRMQLGQYTSNLNSSLREARNVSSLMGGRTEGPLGSFNVQEAGYQELQQANPDVLPKFTSAREYGNYRAEQADKYNKQFEANKRAGIAGVSAATPLKNPDYLRQIMHDNPHGMASPGEKTAGQALQEWLGGFK